MSRAGGVTELPGGEDPELFREMDRVFTQPMSLQRNMFLRAKAYEDQLYPGPSFFHTRDERKLMRKVRKEAFFEMREKYAKLLRGGDSNGFASGPAAVFGSAAQRPLDPAQSDRITFPAPDSYGRLQAGGVVASRGGSYVMTPSRVGRSDEAAAAAIALQGGVATPGPKYDVVTASASMAPSRSALIRGAPRDREVLEKTPGPGAYLGAANDAGPSVSILRRGETAIEAAARRSSVDPGPSRYYSAAYPGSIASRSGFGGTGVKNNSASSFAAISAGGSAPGGRVPMSRGMTDVEYVLVREQRAPTPGPGQYVLPSRFGKMQTSASEPVLSTTTDVARQTSSQTKIQVKSRGKEKANEHQQVQRHTRDGTEFVLGAIPGVRMDGGGPTTELERLMRASNKIPGSAAYGYVSTPGMDVASEHGNKKGGRPAMARGKTHAEQLARVAADTPGPDTYGPLNGGIGSSLGSAPAAVRWAPSAAQPRIDLEQETPGPGAYASAKSHATAVAANPRTFALRGRIRGREERLREQRARWPAPGDYGRTSGRQQEHRFATAPRFSNSAGARAGTGGGFGGDLGGSLFGEACGDGTDLGPAHYRPHFTGSVGSVSMRFGRAHAGGAPIEVKRYDARAATITGRQGDDSGGGEGRTGATGDKDGGAGPGAVVSADAALPRAAAFSFGPPRVEGMLELGAGASLSAAQQAVEKIRERDGGGGVGPGSYSVDWEAMGKAARRARDPARAGRLRAARIAQYQRAKRKKKIQYFV